MVNLIDIAAREVCCGRRDAALKICVYGLGWSFHKSHWLIKTVMSWLEDK